MGGEVGQRSEIKTWLFNNVSSFQSYLTKVFAGRGHPILSILPQNHFEQRTERRDHRIDLMTHIFVALRLSCIERFVGDEVDSERVFAFALTLTP